MLRDLPELPPRMRSLPVDARGYPVPYFVAWLDAAGVATRPGEGTPDFRLVTPGIVVKCHREELCWVCGQTLGVHRSFVIGPISALNRWCSEPPSHLDCADFSARACPFLIHPTEKRREQRMPTAWNRPPGNAILCSPRLAVVWSVRRYQLVQVNDRTVFDIGEPESVRWYTEGRLATRAEVLASIESGLPILLERAKPHGQAGADDIRRRYEACMPFLPADAER